ncbi:hypothetical protein [Brevundimonas sp. SL130]|uniref:hypothetical protein n=1 Tax=Brevundimonas sp. SL130 TaxID=2995143 RepID=UPI00226CB941|nr:hypothetical protein [Brevundimonas sp. SL130]WAC61423.1 hypothetical protein OU998_08300 [Brevundimonas sp. SL130]
MSLPEQSDYRVVMEGRSFVIGPIRRTIVSRGDWKFVEEISNGERRRTLENSDRSVVWSAQWDGQGTHTRMWASHDTASAPTEKPRIERTPETVLGQECNWIDGRPGVQDIGQAQCVAADGMLLIEENTSRGGLTSVLRAVSITAGPARLEGLASGDDPFDPRTWGFPIP